jgi:hypothetical protein
MIKKEKATIPNSSVGADVEQPLCINNTEIIADAEKRRNLNFFEKLPCPEPPGQRNAS